MTAHKMQIKRRPRAPKRSGRKTGDLPIVTTELEARDLCRCVLTVAEQATGTHRCRSPR